MLLHPRTTHHSGYRPPNPTCVPPRSYGVQELNGEKRLTGPGLQSQQPLSVVMTGGPWPSR